MAKAKDGLLTKRYLDRRFSRFKSELKEEFLPEIKNELYQIKDEIVGEIKAIREEFDIHQSSHRRINNELRGHEKRIQVLETPN